MMKKIFLSLLFIALIIGCFMIIFSDKKPKVSVVMLTYNRANIVGQAIESILNQTMKDFEFIILDDGSHDNTDEVIASYMAKDKRIKYYKNYINRGIAHSRNRVLKLAQAKYVMLMDDDDISLPNRMKLQADFLDKNPEIDVVIGQIEGMEKSDMEHGIIASYLVVANNVGNANVMFRRDFTVKNDIFYDESLVVSEDWDFWLSMLFSGAKFAGIKDYVIKRDNNSIKYYKAENFERSDEKVRQKIGQFFTPDNWQKFYEFDACKKVELFREKKLFSESFGEKVYNLNKCTTNNL